MPVACALRSLPKVHDGSVLFTAERGIRLDLRRVSQKRRQDLQKRSGETRPPTLCAGEGGDARRKRGASAA